MNVIKLLVILFFVAASGRSDELMRMKLDVINGGVASANKSEQGGTVTVTRRKFTAKTANKNRLRHLYGIDGESKNAKYQLSEILIHFPKKTVTINPNKLLDLCNPDFVERWGLRDAESGVCAIFSENADSVLISIDGGHPADRYQVIFIVSKEGGVSRFVDNQSP